MFVKRPELDSRSSPHGEPTATIRKLVAAFVVVVEKFRSGHVTGAASSSSFTGLTGRALPPAAETLKKTNVDLKLWTCAKKPRRVRQEEGLSYIYFFRPFRLLSRLAGRFSPERETPVTVINRGRRRGFFSAAIKNPMAEIPGISMADDRGLRLIVSTNTTCAYRADDDDDDDASCIYHYPNV